MSEKYLYKGGFKIPEKEWENLPEPYKIELDPGMSTPFDYSKLVQSSLQPVKKGNDMSLIRNGEKAFAAIISPRSGVDSGGIDYRLDVMACYDLSPERKQELADTAYELYKSICNHTKIKPEKR